MGDSINHDPTLSAGESFTFRIRSAQQRLERKGSRSNRGQQPNARTLFIIKVCRGEGHLRCGGVHDAVHAHLVVMVRAHQDRHALETGLSQGGEPVVHGPLLVLSKNGVHTTQIRKPTFRSMQPHIHARIIENAPIHGAKCVASQPKADQLFLLIPL